MPGSLLKIITCNILFNSHKNPVWYVIPITICILHMRLLKLESLSFLYARSHSLGEAEVGAKFSSFRFRSVAQSCLTLCNPACQDCSTGGFPVCHQLAELAQTHVHRVGDAIQPSHPLSSPFPSAFNLSQHQGLFKWVNSSPQVAKVLKFQLQHQSFQWIFRTDFL